MADIQSNINVNIDTSEALASIKVLQRQISAFYTSMARSGAAANAAVSNMQSNLINTINQTGKFSATIKTVTSTTEAFTTSLEKNKFSLGQYFRYAGGASKTFGKNFRTEMDTIDKVARERVKTLQTQYITMGREANGALKAIAIRPLALDLEDLGTKTAIAAQKQQILNQLLKQGSTNLLNFGKNTQWAGRQLMVGFTIPLSMVGTAAAKTFMQMEEQAIKFKRVYGDSMTPTSETDAMVQQIRDLATEFTKYGVAAEKTMELAATAAAAGKTGADLTAQVKEANRLAVLGQVEQQDALNTTISITNAFGTAASDLAEKINFLNAVENQTVTSIEDLTVAVPKAGPVIQQLGGDVEDLAFFLTAMREGGINASEGANALKSGLASLINPTAKASEFLAGFGINIKDIVESNKGDVQGLVVDFASALDTLDPLNRARAIEQMFGKFQFARLSTLFQNVIKDGSQASRVLDLTSQSSSQLAALASKELGTVAASSMYKFQKAVEDLKVALAPVGEIFLKLVTPVIEFGTQVLENFNKLDTGAKNFILGLVAVVGGLGPVLLMTFGLLANGVANIIKGFMLVRNIFNKSAQGAKFLGDETDYMTQQQLEAAGVAASLEQVHQKLEQRFTSEAGAVNLLSQALERALRAQQAFQGTNGTTRPAMPKKYAQGVVSVPGPKGAGDIIPAMLAPGEAVVPAKQASKYAALIKGIVADNIPGFERGNVKIGPMPTGGSQAQKSKTQFAHVVENAIEVTAQELLNVIDTAKAAGKSVSIKLEKQIRGIVADIDPNKTVRLYGGLGFKQAPGLNVGMRQGGAVKTEDFLQDFIKQGPEKFNQSIKFGGGNLKDPQLQQNLEQYNNEIIKLTEKFKNLSNGATITSDEFGKIEAEARKTLPEFSELRQALNAAETGLYDVRANISEAEFKRAGISLESKEGSGTKSARLSTGAYVRKGGNRASSNRLIEGVGLATFQGISNTTIGVEQGINQAIQRNSPPKRAIQIGKDYGLALNGALSEFIPKIKVAGEAFGLAATTSMTTITPAMMQHLRDSSRRIFQPFLDAQGNVTTVLKTRTQALKQEAEAAKHSAAMSAIRKIALQAESMPLSPIGGGTQKIVSETGQSTSKMSKVGSSIRGVTFALTSLAAAGTMAGGSVGAASNSIMQFSGVAYALMTVMDLLSMASGKAKAGMLAQIGSFLMFSKGGAAKAAGGLGFLASLKKAILPLTGAFRAVGGGLAGFFNVLKVAGPALFAVARTALSFVPVVGWVVGGLTLLGFGIKAYIDQKERERLAVEGVSDAMINTSKELDALANSLGKEKTVSAIERVGTGGTGQQAQVQVTTAETLRSDQSFLDEYRKDIDAMRTMSQRELKSYQDTLAVRLQATGQYSQEEIQGVITALQQEAKRTDVKLDFAAIDITSKDPKVFQRSIDRFAASAKESQGSALSQTQAIEAGNVAISGYYENLMSTSTALMTGVIDMETYTSRVAILRESLNSLGTVAKTKIVDGMFKEFLEALPENQKELGKLASSVEGSNSQLFVMESLTSGSITTLTQLKEVIAALNIVASGVGNGITQAQYDAAKATIDRVTASTKSLNEETANYFKNQSTGTTTGQKSVFQQAAEQIQENIKSIGEASKAYSVLSKAGLSAADAFTLAQDPALAAALATTKVGTDKWKQLVSLAKEFVAVTKNKTLSDTLTKLSGDATRLEKFEKLSRYLNQMGLSSEEISSVLQDEALADSLIKASGDGLKGFKQIDKFISSKLKNIDLRVRIFPEEFVKDGIQKAMEAFSAKENLLNIRFRIDTKADQDLIRETQAKINKLNFQADDFEAGLTRLEDGEEAINEKYNNRIEALDKIIAANDRIAQQNQEELNIFQMVARGDISGAAAGIAQLQQQKAKNALEAKKESLEAQRKNELESLTAEVIVNGQKVMLTRNDIETNLKNIKQQIFDIEENTLEPAQRRVDLAQEALDKAISEQVILGKTKDEWDLIGGEIDAAKTSTTKYLAELQKALDVAKQIPAALAGQVSQEDFDKNPVVPKAKVGNLGDVPGSKAIADSTFVPDTSGSASTVAVPTTPQGSSPLGDVFAQGAGLTSSNPLKPTQVLAKNSSKSVVIPKNRYFRMPYGNYYLGRTMQDNGDVVIRYGTEPNQINKKFSGSVQKNEYGLDGKHVTDYWQTFATGGMVVPKKFANGGYARGTDTVPAMLTPGEFVVSKYGVQNYGVDNLKAINSGTAAANSVYNGYNINVNVRSNSNPDQIANAVMTQIRQINAQQVRGNKF